MRYTAPMGLHHQTHIPGYDGSYALLSESFSTNTVVVFVHGFWGNSYNTWQEFQILADECHSEHPWCKTSDLYFLQYRSITDYVGFNADSLREFLLSIFPTPPPTLFAEDLSGLDWLPQIERTNLQIRQPPYRYAHLILVGHSLGGLIIRKLIHDEVKRFRDSQLPLSQFPLLSASLRLISPAHLGFQPAGPLVSIWKLLNAGVALRALVESSRAFTDLQPHSHVIESVRLETEHFAVQYPEILSLSAHILWADHEDVVRIGEYECDHAPSYSHCATNHLTVCKPKRSYLKPLEFVGSDARAHGA